MNINTWVKKSLIAVILSSSLLSISGYSYYVVNRHHTTCVNGTCKHTVFHKTCADGRCHWFRRVHTW